MKIFSMRDVLEGRQQEKSCEFVNDYDLCNPGIDCTVESSLTQQQFKEECDINRIMANYARTGVLPAGQFQREAVFGEATAHDLASAMELVAQGASAFESLDPDVRVAFGNDPVRFLAAFDDPVEHPRLEKFGFFVRKPEQPDGNGSPAAGNVPIGATPAGNVPSS